jgi:hypothetical protein
VVCRGSVVSPFGKTWDHSRAALAWSRSVSLLQYQERKHVEHLARRSEGAVKIACFKYFICKMKPFTESILRVEDVEGSDVMSV